MDKGSSARLPQKRILDTEMLLEVIGSGNKSLTMVDRNGCGVVGLSLQLRLRFRFF